MSKLFSSSWTSTTVLSRPGPLILTRPFLPAHLVCDSLGNPLAALLTPGQQHEGTVCTELLASVRVRTSTRGGRPRGRPKLVVADRGYDAGDFRRYLRRRGSRCVIP